MYKYNEIFDNINIPYKLGMKLTLDDLKLLKIIYQGCSLIDSTGFLDTAYLMSINNQHIPKRMAIVEAYKIIYNTYLKIKQDDIHFTDNLKNIMESQRCQGETHNHLDILYFLGIDFDKNIYFQDLNPNFDMLDFIDGCKLVIETLAESFLIKGLGENDLNIIKNYNYNVGMLFEDSYDIFLKYRNSCMRKLSFPNEFLRNFLTAFGNFAIVYLLNIDEYNYNSKIVSVAIEKIINQPIKASDSYLSILFAGYKTAIEKNIIFNESKKILDQVQRKLEKNIPSSSTQKNILIRK